jgi:hypothetical protein
MPEKGTLPTCSCSDENTIGNYDNGARARGHDEGQWRLLTAISGSRDGIPPLFMTNNKTFDAAK